MDAFNDPLVEEVVVMSSAQVGKTEILNNVTAYFVDQDPSPILIVQPTLEMGEAWSKDRLAPMLRDTPCLRGKVKDPRARDSGNTLLHKTFPGGHITIAGSNSAASLASRPIRVVLQDEVDRYPVSAGTEGDPCSLADKRTANFWNRKKGKFSTPTIKNASRIESAYEMSDKRRFTVPCPHCGEFQFLFWGEEEKPGGVKWPRDNPGAAEYECLHCKGRWNDGVRWRQIRFGRWEATATFNGTAGFHLNAIYSPWTKLSELAKQFLESKSPERLMTFVNTALGQTWEERHDIKIDSHELHNRCETYESDVPGEVVIITAGVDVQADRLVVEITGWGRDEESWSLAHHVIPGDTIGTEVWRELDKLLLETFPHPGGAPMHIRAVCIDTGWKDATVLRFTRDRYNRRIFAIKGRSGDHPIWARKPSKKNQTPFWMVGVDPAKDAIYDRLRIAEPGAGYCHFPMGYELDFFEELTSEKKITQYHHGFPKRVWKKQDGARNEALDCRVYAYAALYSLYAAGLRLNPEADRIAALVAQRSKQPRPADSTSQPQQQIQPRRRLWGRMAV